MKPFYIFFFITFLIFPDSGISQSDEITLEGIWKNDTYLEKDVASFNFTNDGLHFTRIGNKTIEKFNLATGRRVTTLFDGSTYEGLHGFGGEIDGYDFSDDESLILIHSETEKIYRRSTIANYYIFDPKARSFRRIFDEGKIACATFSPDGKKVAFVFQNNIYYRDLDENALTQITTDGRKNQIINGTTDWVYEEEFGFVQAFHWSDDSEKIAFLRFDETEVEEFSINKYEGGSYPEKIEFKYPKVGEQNSILSLHIYHTNNQNRLKIDLGEMDNYYLPKLLWTRDDDKLAVVKLNRFQNHMQLYLVDAKKGVAQLTLEEQNKYYVDMENHLSFLEDGRHFLLASEKNGYNHLYLYDLKGEEKKQLTSGQYDVTDYYGFDAENDLVYYQAAETSPLERQVFRVNIKTGMKQLLTDFKGFNSAQFSSTFGHFVWTRSTINEPPSYRIHTSNLQPVRVIEENSELRERQSEADVNPVEFFSFTTSENVLLNGYMIKPSHFNLNRRYPVLMYLYGGPGSQKVAEKWIGPDYWWFQMLADQGYLIACVDNRGTGGRGEEFKKMTYQQLGKYETLDQIEAARYLGNLPYTDAQRIGIFGWSYGGYLSSLCLLKGNTVFKAAIAVAPVTHWKWYDSIYTERYMRTEEENENGYREGSPINFVDQLTGNYLLVHGMADDNVHFQNSVEMSNALILANKQFDTFVYPNNAHSIKGSMARLHLYTKMSNFLFEKL